MGNWSDAVKKLQQLKKPVKKSSGLAERVAKLEEQVKK